MIMLCPWQTDKLSRLIESYRISPSFNHCRITDYQVCFTCVARIYHVCRPVVFRGKSFEQFKTFYRVRHRFDFFPRPATSINWLELSFPQKHVQNSFIYQFWIRKKHDLTWPPRFKSLHRGEHRRLLHWRPLFDWLWPWLSRKALCDLKTHFQRAKTGVLKLE